MLFGGAIGRMTAPVKIVEVEVPVEVPVEIPVEVPLETLSLEDTAEWYLSLVYQAMALMDEASYWIDCASLGIINLITFTEIMGTIRLGFENLKENVEFLGKIAHESCLESISHFKKAIDYIIKGCRCAEDLNFEMAAYYFNQATMEMELANNALPSL